MKHCPTCKKRGIISTSCDVSRRTILVKNPFNEGCSSLATLTNYSFHCGHYRHVLKRQ